MKASQNVVNATYKRVRERLKEIRDSGKGVTRNMSEDAPLGSGVKREWVTTPPVMPQAKQCEYRETSDGIIITYYPIEMKDGKPQYDIQMLKNTRGDLMAVNGKPIHGEKTEFFGWKPKSVPEKVVETIKDLGGKKDGEREEKS